MTKPDDIPQEVWEAADAVIGFSLALVLWVVVWLAWSILTGN
jgi:hypothetical protein